MNRTIAILSIATAFIGVSCSRTSLLDELDRIDPNSFGDAGFRFPSASDASSASASGREDASRTDAAESEPPFDAGNVVVGSVAPCIATNVSTIHFDGENDSRVQIKSGTYQFPPTGNIWTQCGTDASKDPSELQFACPAAVAENTSGMGFYFRSSKNTSISVGVYKATKQDDDGQPKLSIGASGIYGSECGGLEEGAFQIERLEFDEIGAPRRVLVTFESHCDDAPGVLRGCAYLAL